MDIVENEDVRCVLQKGETESGLNPRLGSTGDKEFDLGNPFDESTQYREDRRRWFFILALVKSVDHDRCRNSGLLQWFHYQLLHLTVEGFMYNIGIQPKERDDGGSECRVFSRQLGGEGGEDEVEVAAVFEIAGAEERCPKEPLGESPLANRLGNRRLASTGESIQPEDGRFFKVFGPGLDLLQYRFSRTTEAAFAIPVLVPGPGSTATAVQDRQVSCQADK